MYSAIIHYSLLSLRGKFSSVILALARCLSPSNATDLSKVHILALEALLSGKKKTAVYNLGNGLGYSVKEVIETCEKVTGRKAVIEYTDRRPGDPARLVASSQKIYEELGWKAEYSLEEIIASAWKWHSRNTK